MSETIHTPGIVLYYTPWREVDRQYVIYTERFGKVRARALGIRKPTAKLAGVLEPFSETDVHLIMGKTCTIGGAIVQKRFTDLIRDKAKHNATLYCSDVLDRVTKEGVPDHSMYHLLYSTLTWLDHAPYSKLIPISFAVKLINLLGYQLPEHKVTRWLTTATFTDIQKLRLSQADWQAVYQQVHVWLYEYCGADVQSERFLV